MTKVNHHFVPCAYLQGFSNDPSLGRKSVVEIFDVKDKKNRPASVESIMYEKNFYDIDRDGLPVDIAEDVFSELFESGLPSIITKIDNKEALNSQEIDQICKFIGFQEFRTHYRKERINQFYEEIEQHGIKTSDNEKLKTFFKNMFLGDQVIGTTLRGRKWYVFQSNKGDFITSDHPLYLCRPKDVEENMPLGVGLATLCFPLSKHSYLVAKYGEEDLPGKNGGTKNITYSDADDFLTKVSNRYSCWDINRFVVGKDGHALQDVIDIIKGDKSLEDCEKELENICL